jgi:predicted HTH domain antitoxin
MTKVEATESIGIAKRVGDILLERGLFENEDRLLLSAYRSLLTLRPDLKIEIALSLYEGGEVSLGRAAEIGGLSREDIKELLASKGIERRVAVRSPDRIAEDVKFLLGD